MIMLSGRRHRRENKIMECKTRKSGVKDDCHGECALIIPALSERGWRLEQNQGENSIIPILLVYL